MKKSPYFRRLFRLKRETELSELTLPGLVISSEDLAVARQLMTDNVLTAIDPMHLNLRDGDVVISCSDGDQFHYVMTWIEWLMKHFRDVSRPHVHALNGGPLLIPQGSPLARAATSGPELVEHSRGSLTMKQMPGVLSIGHFPCGAAAEVGLSLLEVIALHMRSKDTLKDDIPEVRVQQFFYINFGPAATPCRGMFAITRASWRDWCTKQRIYHGTGRRLASGIAGSDPVLEARLDHDEPGSTIQR